MKPTFIKDVDPEYYYEKKISMGLYRCECGNEFTCRKTKIKTGATQSCGCLKQKSNWNREYRGF
jgi:hypothetical protein